MEINLIFYAFFISIIAIVYYYILSKEPVLNWWFMFGMRFEKKWFYKPIWGCELCFAGQLALWTYIANWSASYFGEKSGFDCFLFVIMPQYKIDNYSLFWLVCVISMSIFFTFLNSKLFNNLKK